MSNHQWTQALRLDDPAYVYYGTYYYNSQDVFADSSFEATIANPPPEAAFYYRAAFYTYTPDSDKTLNVQGAETTGADIFVFLYTRAASTWQAVPNASPAHDLLNTPVTGGTTYYVMFAYGADTPTDGQLFYLAQVSDPPASLDIDAVPVHVGVSGGTRIVGDVDTVDIPALHTTVGIGAPELPAEVITDVSVPPIGVNVGVSVPTAWAGSFLLTSPEDGTTVLTNTPDFVVAVLSEDDEAQYTVQVQYDDNATMTSPVVLSDDVEAVDGGAILSPTTGVPNSTYWQARLLEGSEVRSDWSAVQSFTVSTVSTTASLPITWTVTASAPRAIHVWHIDPPGPDVGDTVIIYGQGFPTSGHLSFGDQLLDVASWTYVDAADENSGDDTRVIDADTVTPEHYEVTFVAPTYDGPGAALTVED